MPPARRSAPASLSSSRTGPCRSWRAPSVLQDLRSLHHDVAAGLDVDLPGAVDRDVLALDLDRSILLHRDAGAAGLDGHRVARVDHEVLADLQCVILADGGRPGLCHARGLGT